MNRFAGVLVTALKKADPDIKHSDQLLIYSLTIILNTLFIIVVSLLIGLVTGKFVDTIISIISILFIRIISGGPHIRSMWGCNIFSIVLCVAIPHIPIIIPIDLITGISCVLLLLFSPNPDENSKMPKGFFPYLKILSVIVAASNFFLNNDVIGLVMLFQSITIIPLRKGVQKL